MSPIFVPFSFVRIWTYETADFTELLYGPISNELSNGFSKPQKLNIWHPGGWRQATFCCFSWLSLRHIERGPMVSVARLRNSVVRLLFSFTFGVYEYYVLALCFALLFLVCFFVFCDEFLLLLFCYCLCCLLAVLFLLLCVFMPPILCFGWTWASNELLADNVIVTCDFFLRSLVFFWPIS